MSKYYAVAVGRVPGIYTNWPEAQKQVMKFKNAKYKSFATKQEAEAFLNGTKAEVVIVPKDALQIYVDGSFNKQTKTYGSGWLVVQNGKILDEGSFRGDAKGEVDYSSSFQVPGEVFGSLKAMEWALDNGYSEVYIAYDYMGIEAWATGQWQARSEIAKRYVKELEPIKEKLTIHFVKIAAHTGEEFNERADYLAKKAVCLI